MNKLVLPAVLAAGVLALAPPVQAIDLPGCTPRPQCCPLDPQCYTTDPKGVAVAGTGSISPGLPCPVSCDVHLDFTLVGAGVGVGVANCTFDGTTGADTIVAGTGNGTIDCSGGITVSGSCHFDRTGPVVTVGCSATVNGVGSGITAVLAFVPLSANPTTSFAVVGGGVVL
jgi:hypothetical protein